MVAGEHILNRKHNAPLAGDAMSRRSLHRLVALTLLLFLLLLGSITWLRWLPRTDITRANAARIENGMTLEQVEAILGGAPRDESTGILDPDLKMGGGPDMRSREWRSDEVIIHLMFDRDGLVNSITAVPVRRADTQDSLFAQLRRMIGL
jgi:hypothetical protein